MNKKYYVYILTNKPKGTLYIGITNNLSRRVYEHQHGLIDGFTKKYKLKKLVFFEETDNVQSALQKEKQLKNWHRDWKINLVEEVNPSWNDLSELLYNNRDPETSSG